VHTLSTGRAGRRSETGERIVDTMGVLGVLAAAVALTAAPPTLNPQRLPQLPARGLVHMTAVGVELETLQGRRLGMLRGLRLAQQTGAHGGLLSNRRGDRFFAIDRMQRRLRRVGSA